MNLKQMIALSMLALSGVALASCGKVNKNDTTPKIEETPDTKTDDTQGSDTSNPSEGGTTTGGETGETTGESSSGGGSSTTGGSTTGGSSTGGSTSGGNSGSAGDSTTGGNSGGSTGSSTNKKVDANVDGVISKSDSTGTVKDSGNLVVNKVIGMQESLYITWGKKTGDYKVYAQKDGGEYTLLNEDDYYIQSNSSTTRLDVFGLAKGNYNIKITSGSVDTICNVDVSSYDRSGYAHYKNTDGVGAYNDDGTLKDNAVVIYVTDDTKNSVTLTYGTKSVSGIGNILNSVGQETTEAGHAGQCKKVSGGKTYYGIANDNDGIINYLAQNNVPLVVRFVGCVSESGLYESGTYSAADKGLIDGLTDYDCVDYGGSEGDNGHMARIRGGANITLEGVGDDAIIDGWGFHFIAETGTNYGKNFEVRNLAFINTPEDAIGMEGQQAGGLITGSVERCWVHHNSFFKPTISNPAESDKGEGDGSCDFKRGQYFTMSYNYFEYCHKTNLIGSADDSLQYNLSYHHNLWYNCGSRIPLLRQSNIHFYNNYILVSAGASVSYVTSLRANGYMYSEFNYYEGCKQVYEKKTGTAKGFGNTYVGIYNTDDVYEVDDRETKVSSSCAYNGTSYQNFDTNASLFYYNSANKKSDCYLTSSVDARSECIKYSGSRYRTSLNKASLSVENTNSNVNNVDSAIKFTNGIYTATIGTADTGIIYTSVKNSKFKGQGITFRLDKAAMVTLNIESGSTNAYNAGYLVKSNGEVMLSGSGTCVLEAGLYYITSGQFDKESTVSLLKFEEYNSEELAQKQIDAYNTALANIGTVTYTDACFDLIDEAMEAYNTLSAEQKSNVDYATLEAKYNEYINLGKSYVESLISAIGTVDENSGNAIVAARGAYNDLIEVDDEVVISNYATLTSAESAYASFAINNTINLINAIGTVTLDSKEAIEAAENAYEYLTDSQKAQVTNYATLVAAISTYKDLKAVAEVNELISSNPSTLDDLEELYETYNELSETLKSKIDASAYNTLMVAYVNLLIDELPESTSVTLTDKEDVDYVKEVYATLSDNTGVLNYTKVEECDAVLEELKNARQVVTFSYTNKKLVVNGDSDFFTISGNGKNNLSVTYEGTTYTEGLKMESSTSIEFTASKVSKLILVTDSTSKKVEVNGVIYTTDASGVLEVEVEVGTVNVKKGDSLVIVTIIVE